MEKQLVANGKVKYEMEFQPVSSKNERSGRGKKMSILSHPYQPASAQIAVLVSNSRLISDERQR